jgi:hypothetical protein
MSSTNRTDEELENLLWEITVDCKDEDEVMMGFEGFFESEASFPWRGSVIGEEIEVMSLGIAENRPELMATCKHGEHTYEVALLDIDKIDADTTTSRLIAAYRRWADAR